MQASLEWLRHAGVGAIVAYLLWQMFSAGMTHAFRNRTAEELATMQAQRPWVYKLLMVSKTLGIDSPQFRQLLATIFFARLMAGNMAEQAAPEHVPTDDGA